MMQKNNLTDQYAKIISDEPSVTNQEAKYQNFVEILRHHALDRPDKRVYTLLSDGEFDEVQLTFRELDQQARVYAARFNPRCPW